jgi:hypothetical protein
MAFQGEWLLCLCKEKRDTHRYHSPCQASYGAHVAPQRCTIPQTSESVFMIPFLYSTINIQSVRKDCTIPAEAMHNLNGGSALKKRNMQKPNISSHNPKVTGSNPVPATNEMLEPQTIAAFVMPGNINRTSDLMFI